MLLVCSCASFFVKHLCFHFARGCELHCKDLVSRVSSKEADRNKINNRFFWQKKGWQSEIDEYEQEQNGANSPTYIIWKVLWMRAGEANPHFRVYL